jgi:hypothetical protein
MQPIHFKAQITESIYVRAQNLHIRERPTFWLCALVIAAAIFVRVGGDVFFLLANLILALVLILLALGGTWWYLMYCFRAQYRRLRDVYQPMDVTIDDEGIRYRSEDGTLDCPWSKLRRALLYPDFALIDRAEGVFLIFDRHFFKSSEEWESFFGEIVHRLPVRTHGRRLYPGT